MDENKLTIAFNVFESYELGAGHIIRCISLANKIWDRNSVAIHFITNSGHPALSMGKFTIHSATPELSHKSIKDVFLKIRPDIIVYDIPFLTGRYISETALPQSLVIIFDYYNRDEKLEGADIVFNFHHSEGMNRFITCTFYEGMEYGILRDEFYLPYRLRKRTEDRINVLLTVGSTDPLGITGLVLDALLTYSDTRLAVHVVLGRNNRNAKDIYGLSEGSRHRIEIHEEVNNMAKLMSKMDLAFVSGGVTLFEVMHMNVPAVIICAHRFAFELASYLEKHNCAVNLGYYDRVSRQMIHEALDELILSDKLKTMKKNQTAIDINGGDKIVDIIFTEAVNRMSISRE